MKILKEIRDETVGLGDSEQLGSQYELRKSARAILLNDKGEMATQYLNTYNYHKLPGGGIEIGESVEKALKREVMEEVGCDCKIIESVGMTIEYRNQWMWLHISTCFVVKVVGEIGEAQLEPAEIEEGQKNTLATPGSSARENENGYNRTIRRPFHPRA